MIEVTPMRKCRSNFFDNFCVVVQNTGLNTVERTTKYRVDYKTIEHPPEPDKEEVDSLFGDDQYVPAKFMDEELELKKSKSAKRPMGFKVFACAKNIHQNQNKKEVTPVRLQSLEDDMILRKRTKGYINFSSQLRREDFVKASKIRIHDARLGDSPGLLNKVRKVYFDKQLPRMDNVCKMSEPIGVDNDQRTISHKRIRGLEFGKMVGREKSEFFQPPKVATDPVDDLVFKLNMMKREKNMSRRRIGSKLANRFKRANIKNLKENQSLSMSRNQNTVFGSTFYPQVYRTQDNEKRKEEFPTKSSNSKYHKSCFEEFHPNSTTIVDDKNKSKKTFVQLLVDNGYLDIGTKSKSRYKLGTALDSSYKSLVTKIIGVKEALLDDSQFDM